MNISDQIGAKISSITKLLQEEKDIVIKYDKKRNVVKIFSQQVKKVK